MKATSSILLAAAIATFSSVDALAQTASGPAMSADTKGMQPAAVGDMTGGEVRKVDKDTKKITLKHGEIKNLGMPGMTMVFQVKDPAMLDTVKVGDKVKFNAEKMNGSLTVTNIEQAKQ